MALKSSMDHVDKGAQIAEELDDLEHSLDRLKVLYEQYFMGIQKIPPAQLHKTVQRKILKITQGHLKNTGLRFRLNTLTQKFGVYNTYWKRILRKIEQGTYIRDVARVKRRAEAMGQDIPEEVLATMPKRMREEIRRRRGKVASRAARKAEADAEADAGKVKQPPSHVHRLDESDADVDLDALFDQITSDEPAKPAKPGAEPARKPASRTGATPPPKPASTPEATPPPIPSAARGSRPAPPRPAAGRSAAGPPGMTEAQIRDLHKRYNQARKLVGEKGAVPYDKLVRTISKQAPRIMKQHRVDAVDFNVVIKDDRVVLKAKPKK